MNVNHITKIDKKGAHYISALMHLHGVRQDIIAEQTKSSRTLVSLVAARKRGIQNARGPKIIAIRKAIAEALDMPEGELFDTDRESNIVNNPHNKYSNAA